MEQKITIADFVARADKFADEERTPFAEDPWRPESEIIFQDGDRTDPIVQDGKVFGYFLEASVILEIREWLPDESQTAWVERVVQYAINDA